MKELTSFFTAQYEHKGHYILTTTSFSTYLLVWNPNRWQWNTQELTRNAYAVSNGEILVDRWSCGKTKRIKRGDRVFIIRLGKEPRGIFASGWVIKNGSFEAPHWDNEQAKMGKISRFVQFSYDILLNPLEDMIIERDILKHDLRFSKMHWDSQMSGVQIPHEVAVNLEKMWIETIKSAFDWYTLPEELDKGTLLYEGAKRTIIVNSYERNPKARKQCIGFYGLKCIICGFDFEQTYGDFGKGLIHVHHLKPLADIRKDYVIDPIKDLRPVCPNCHVVIHRRKPVYSINEVKNILSKQHL